MKLTPEKRERLKPSQFACPPKDYPIPDPTHVSSAIAYYQRPYTKKCPGGKERICKAARKFGMMKSPKVRRFCGE
jgi:hypothetical protein